MVTAASDKVEARLNHSERIPRITQSKTQSGGNFGDKKKWDETDEPSSKQKGVARSSEQRYRDTPAAPIMLGNQQGSVVFLPLRSGEEDPCIRW
jgi:hypothetical protein